MSAANGKTDGGFPRYATADESPRPRTYLLNEHPFCGHDLVVACNGPGETYRRAMFTKALNRMTVGCVVFEWWSIEPVGAQESELATLERTGG